MRPTILPKNKTLRWAIYLYDDATGVLIDADSTPTVAVRKNGGSTADTVTVTKRSATTGIYDCVFDPTGEVDGDIFEFAESAVVLGTTYINAFNVVVPPSLAFVFDPVFSVVRGRVADSTMNFYRGETINATITVTDASGLAVDLSTKTLRLVFENATTGTDIASVTSFTLGGAGNNNATFAVPSAVTSAVTGTTPHVWSLRDTADGNRVLALGSVVVRSAATVDA